MKATQVLQQNQQLALTPQLLQQIRLLQLSRLELEQTLQTALLTNVMLETDDDLLELEDEELAPSPEMQDEIAEAYDVSWDQPAQAASTDFNPLSNVADEPGDLTTHLHMQINTEFRDLLDQALALELVDACEDNGYLEADFPALCRQLSREYDTTPRHIEQILKRVQQLDPVGFAARSLCECLSIQLELMANDVPGKALALRIVNEDLGLLATHETPLIARHFNTTEEEALQAEQLILSLDPRPGDQITPAADVIYPDVVVRRIGSQWRVELARDRLPKLRINSTYERLLTTDSSASGHEAMREQLTEARWIVRGLEIRNDTLSRAAAVIFDRQKNFLEKGVEGLAPLTLKEVADAIGMHESTVCRITTNKYVQTPRGVFELKFFFSSQLNRKDGSEIAGTAVRAMVHKIIATEDHSTPLSDGVIAKILARKGICIARRTVAKYREAMNIAPAKQRIGQCLSAMPREGMSCQI